MIRRLAVVTIAVGAALAAANVARGSVSSNVSVPLNIGVFVPCANEGTGESVSLSGRLHVLATTTVDSSDGVHGTLVFNPQDVSGTGTISGTSYRGTGATLSTFNTNVGSVTTVVNDFLIIASGSAPSLRIHENIVVVVNAQGLVTATVDNSSASCG